MCIGWGAHPAWATIGSAGEDPFAPRDTWSPTPESSFRVAASTDETCGTTYPGEWAAMIAWYTALVSIPCAACASAQYVGNT
jgi:hypothetical protein